MPLAKTKPDPRQCQYVEHVPIYSTQIGGFLIDPSEYTSPEGVMIGYDEKYCKFVADLGHRHCPRHEMEFGNVIPMVVRENKA